jgi:hypothetical protein
MFDDKSFSRSKLYFNIQQLCRVFSACIQETIGNLHGHRNKFLRTSADPRHLSKDVLEDLLRKWLDMIEESELKLKPILERINRKREEVESLRDGVSPTSSEVTTLSTDLKFLFSFSMPLPYAKHQKAPVYDIWRTCYIKSQLWVKTGIAI